jgi:hypothetical protein
MPQDTAITIKTPRTAGKPNQCSLGDSMGAARVFLYRRRDGFRIPRHAVLDVELRVKVEI